MGSTEESRGKGGGQERIALVTATHWDQGEAEMVVLPHQMAHSNAQSLQGGGGCTVVCGQDSRGGGRGEGGIETNQSSPKCQSVSMDSPHGGQDSACTADYTQCTKEQVAWEERHLQYLQPPPVDHQRNCMGQRAAGGMTATLALETGRSLYQRTPASG